MLAWKQTSGIVVQSISIPYESNLYYDSPRVSRNITFTFIDVEGQRNNWKQWLHHFSDIDVAIFLVAVSDYNQVVSLYDKILHQLMISH